HVIVLFGGLLRQLFQHFRLGFRAEYQANLLVPCGVDLVQFPRPRVNQLLERAPLLLHARNRELCSLQRIQHPQKMLPLPEDNLRGAIDPPVFFFFMLHQVRTSHVWMLPIAPGPATERNILTNSLLWKAHKIPLLSGWHSLDYLLGLR